MLGTQRNRHRSTLNTQNNRDWSTLKTQENMDWSTLDTQTNRDWLTLNMQEIGDWSSLNTQEKHKLDSKISDMRVGPCEANEAPCCDFRIAGAGEDTVTPR